MFTFLIILITIIAILMTLVVLIQSGKGGGLAGIAAGGATQQVLGARQAPDVLEKATWTMATMFIVLCILTNFFIDKEAVQDSVIQQRAQDGQTEEVVPVLPPPPAGVDDAATGDQGSEGAAVPPPTPPSDDQ